MYVEVGEAEQWREEVGTEAVDNGHLSGVVGTAEGVSEVLDVDR
jgi:hypothetical protein